MFLHISTFWVLCILGEQNNSLIPISWDCLQSGSRCYLWNSGNFLGSDVKDSSKIHLDNFLTCPNCPNLKTSFRRRILGVLLLWLGHIVPCHLQRLQIGSDMVWNHNMNTEPGQTWDQTSRCLGLDHRTWTWCCKLCRSQPLHTWTAQTSSSTSSITAVIGGYRGWNNLKWCKM